MTITIDPLALITTVFILVTMYFFAIGDALRLTILTVIAFFLSYFRIMSDIPREAVISVMDVVFVFIVGAAVVVLYSVYHFAKKRKKDEHNI